MFAATDLAKVVCAAGAVGYFDRSLHFGSSSSVADGLLRCKNRTLCRFVPRRAVTCSDYWARNYAKPAFPESGVIHTYNHERAHLQLCTSSLLTGDGSMDGRRRKESSRKRLEFNEYLKQLSLSIWCFPTLCGMAVWCYFVGRESIINSLEPFLFLIHYCRRCALDLRGEADRSKPVDRVELE